MPGVFKLRRPRKKAFRLSNLWSIYKNTKDDVLSIEYHGNQILSTE